MSQREIQEQLLRLHEAITGDRKSVDEIVEAQVAAAKERIWERLSASIFERGNECQRSSV
jgi:AAA+ superfamily predicted ATPase